MNTIAYSAIKFNEIKKEEEKIYKKMKGFRVETPEITLINKLEIIDFLNKKEAKRIIDSEKKQPFLKAVFFEI